MAKRPGSWWPTKRVTRPSKRHDKSRVGQSCDRVNRISLTAVEDYGVDRVLRDLPMTSARGRYRPAPARRVEIPKAPRGTQPLGIPTEATQSPVAH
jgi:hypothetical protein